MEDTSRGGLAPSLDDIGAIARESFAALPATFRRLAGDIQFRVSEFPDEDVLGDAVAFAGVARYPARVKCALLPWMAFKDAALRAGVGVSS